jgi:hypothetical protein
MIAATASPSYAPPPHQRDVDDMVARVRAELAQGTRSLFKPAPAHAASSANMLDARLGEELQAVRRQLDQLGDILSHDPILLSRHAHALQGLDRVDQVLAHLATVMGRENKSAAVEQISMSDLKARLQRRSLG